MLRAQAAPQKVFLLLFSTFAQSVLDYACFNFHREFCNNTRSEEFEKIYRGTIKHAFNLSKTTNNSLLCQILNLPSPFQ